MWNALSASREFDNFQDRYSWDLQDDWNENRVVGISYSGYLASRPLLVISSELYQIKGCLSFGWFRCVNML